MKKPARVTTQSNHMKQQQRETIGKAVSSKAEAGQTESSSGKAQVGQTFSSGKVQAGKTVSSVKIKAGQTGLSEKAKQVLDPDRIKKMSPMAKEGKYLSLLSFLYSQFKMIIKS